MRGSSSKLLISLLTLSLLFGVMLPLAAQGIVDPDDEEVRVFILGPDLVGSEQKAEYRIIVTGGPGEAGGTFTYESEIRGTNLTVTALEPATGESDVSGFFTATLNAPNEAQEIELVVTGFSDRNGIKDSAEVVKVIKIIEPYRLTATVSNEGDINVDDLTIRFYVDGELLETQNLGSLGPEETKVVISNWTVENPAPGRHVARIELDTEDAGVILEESGSRVYLREFYIQEEESSAPWVLSIMVLIAAAAGSMYMLRKSGYF